jgi:hypothetical protein
MKILKSMSLASFLTLATAAAPAIAGPCSDQIMQISRTLSQHGSVSGSPTTGTLNGAGPDSAKSSAAQPNTQAQADGTSSKGKLNGDSGGKEMSAASSNVATSPEDVRRQQAGVPTTADNPSAKTPDQRVAQAQMQLDRAKALDAKGDTACRDAAQKASQLANSNG